VAIGYVGIPGSGKSHDLVQEVIIPALQAGKTVYTNIPLNTGNMMRIHHLTTAQINGLNQYPDETDETGRLKQTLSDLYIPSEDKEINKLQKCVIVHDEVQGSLPLDERRSNPDLKRIRNYIEHHRHYDVELHWASQSEHLVDVTLRRLTDTIYLYKNLKHNSIGKLSKHGRYRRRLYMMSDGEVDKEMITESIVDINPHTFMCYKSFVGNDTAGKFKAPMPRFLRNGIIIASLLAGVVLPMTVYKTYSWYKKITTKQGAANVAKDIENDTPSKAATIIGAITGENIEREKRKTIEYDSFYYDDSDGSYILCQRGIPVARCRNPGLDGIGKENCGAFDVERVEDSRLLDGPTTVGPSEP